MKLCELVTLKPNFVYLLIERWIGVVVKDHEMVGGTCDQRKSQNTLELLESMACDCALVYWL